MKSRMTGFCAVLGTVLCSHSPAQGPTFEVASVKHLAADSGQPGSNLMRGGPGTQDPGRILFACATLKRLLMAAYGVEVDQIAGPGWLDSERYAVDAKLPPGKSREQLRQMLQALIMERFQAALHHETRVTTGYELTVSRRGARLTPADPNAPSQPPPGRYTAVRTEAGTTRLTFHAFSIANLAAVLGMPLGGLAGNRVASVPVADHTGLTGKYDFTLEFAGYMGPGGAFPPSDPDSPPPAGPNLFDAVETQLGLRLAEKKVPHDVVVVDAIDKTPVGN
jgi:uncharacterized protein (TIGR03435 family)